MAAVPDRLEATLQGVNRRLADLLERPALDLAAGGGKAMGDTVWVWGIVGGKDVGKTTLINALAGGPVAQPGEIVGEGTWRPTVYLAADDVEALRTRWADCREVDVAWEATAPAAMRRLALVDLPDFDSLFGTHLQTVHRLAPLLDGIIWVTSPKKLGDLRAIHEIERVLKARSNFVYVVNKMDWLIAQSEQPPTAVLARTADALRDQLTACDDHDDPGRCFFVAARYQDANAMVTAMKDCRGAAAETNGSLDAAARTLADDFARLHRTLTVAPTPEAAVAHKSANLRFQVVTQARQIESHYQPAARMERIERMLASAPLQEAVERYVPLAYFAAVGQRANHADRWAMSWALTLFQERIAAWSLLGLIAWPCLLLVSWIQEVRGWLADRTGTAPVDPVRVGGVDLEDRVGGVLCAVQAQAGGMLRDLPLRWPATDAVARVFRGDVLALFEAQRDAVFEQARRRRPGAIGRFLRGMLPWGLVLWFTLLQPLGSTVLDSGLSDGAWSLGIVRAVLEVLSPLQVLYGLAAAVVLLAVLTSVVFSGAVRDAHRACRRLVAEVDAEWTQPLQEGLLSAVTRPLRDMRDALSAEVDALQRCRAD